MARQRFHRFLLRRSSPSERGEENTMDMKSWSLRSEATNKAVDERQAMQANGISVNESSKSQKKDPRVKRMLPMSVVTAACSTSSEQAACAPLPDSSCLNLLI